MEQAKHQWIEEARHIAAQCWCDETTSHIEMDVELAESVAQRIAAWMETGSQHATNEFYWRDRATNVEQQRDEFAAENLRLIAELNTALKQVKTEQRLSFRDQVAELEQKRDEYRDTVAQQAELLAAHKAELQDWQRELLKAQQERDELLADAERYRWLAGELFTDDAGKVCIANGCYVPNHECDRLESSALDDAIDAAIAKVQK